MGEPASDFVVLLVGGASGSGKTSLGQPLARRLGVNLTEVDDIQIALEAATTERDLPLLHFWRNHLDEYSTWSDDRRVAHHIRIGVRVVYEGDFLLPEMATFATYGDEPNAGRVRALFVSEPDDTQIADNYRAREGEVKPERARTSALFDAFLRAECARYDVPVVHARPWPSVVERAMAALR